jgi:hypothetical protein
MSELPDVKFSRTKGKLGRTRPTIDNVFGLAVSGVAVVDKIALAEPKAIFGLEGLTDLGITLANNPLAYTEIINFYAKAGEGTKLWIMLYSDAVLLADLCDKTTGVLKNMLLVANGELTGLFINKKMPAGYVQTLLEGLDQDVWNAAVKLQALCEEFGSDNQPLFAVLPGFGFTFANVATIRDLSSMTANQVHISLAADDNTGKPAIGTLAGWLAAISVNTNAAWVGLGAVLTDAWFIGGTNAGDKSIVNSLGALHDKRFGFFRKITGKAGFFFNDDPTACPVSDDFSSISWNRVINKAHRLAYNKLVEHLNEDFELDTNTGGISPAVAAAWEGDVEGEVDVQMIRKKQASAVKCIVEATSVDVAQDKVKAQLQIVRNGQAKGIEVAIGYATSL